MNTERPDNDDAPAAREDGAGRPARRRPPGLAIASVAAAVLLVGAGGVYLATSATGGGQGGGPALAAPGSSGTATPPPLALDGFGAGAQGGGPGIAPGERNPYGTVYRADAPLPEGPGSAPVYRVPGEVSGPQVARLAKALGIDGAPRARGEVWTAGNGKDGSGPLLTVTRQAPGTWTFHRYAPGTDDCGKGPVCKAPSAGGEPVGEAAALKAAAPVLEALGQGDAELDARQVLGASRAVNAEPRVGGLPTYGWTTGVIVDPRGEVIGGSGRMSAPVKGDTYPVLDAERTLELLNTPGGAPARGAVDCARPVPLEEGADQPCAPVAPTGTPGTPGTPDKRAVATVEGAVFGLAAQSVRGQQALVPSWLFEVREPGTADPYTVTYPAVEPRFLTGVSPSSPVRSGEPSPAGTASSRTVPVAGYTAEGSELTVYFTGGVCSDYDVSAREEAGAVRVTVTETPRPGEVCILIAKEYERTVPLDGPLGDRRVVGPDGTAVPRHRPGARLPASPGAR